MPLDILQPSLIPSDLRRLVHVVEYLFGSVVGDLKLGQFLLNVALFGQFMYIVDEAAQQQGVLGEPLHLRGDDALEWQPPAEVVLFAVAEDLLECGVFLPSLLDELQGELLPLAEGRRRFPEVLACRPIELKIHTTLVVFLPKPKINPTLY